MCKYRRDVSFEGLKSKQNIYISICTSDRILYNVVPMVLPYTYTSTVQYEYLLR